MPRLRRRIALVASVVVSSIAPVSSGVAQPEPEPVQITVMSFNIWYGATVTQGLDEVVEAIRKAGADVVGMQEPYARLRRIARELGFHVSPRMHVISRFPILEPRGSDGTWAYLLLAPGQVAAIANTHLSCCPYTPYRIVNRGFDRAAALEQERNTRVRQIRKHLRALEPLLSAEIPTFFTGDFNSPSWRDWTPVAVEARGLPYPMRWPVSLAMEAAGFRDSYRRVHPDPVRDPGFTWTPGYPAPFVYPWDVFDRIDFVWAAGPATALRSVVVGESSANADVVVRPYPTDHRGVASTFSVRPAAAPEFVVAEGESARLGLPLRARYHAPGIDGGRVELAAGGSAQPIAQVPTDAGGDGTAVFETTDLEQGAYDVVLVDQGGLERSRDTVVLFAEGQKPILTLADPTLEGDQKLEIRWSFAPGNRFDWFGVYRAGASPKIASYKVWRYLGGAVEGTLTIGPGARGPASWPLSPGRYEVHLLLDDSYRTRASVPFRVLG